MMNTVKALYPYYHSIKLGMGDHKFSQSLGTWVPSQGNLPREARLHPKFTNQNNEFGFPTRSLRCISTLVQG